MATRIFRRSVAAAGLATVVTTVAPVAVSFAAPSAFAASSITTDPAPDSSNVVAANRPTIIAKFTDTVASGSIRLTVDGGSSTNLCASQSISGQTITCQPGADLDKTKTYDAVGTAKDSAGHSASTSVLKFTVDYPVLDGASSTPVPNGTLVNGSENIVAAFDEAVTGNTTTSAADGAFKLYEVNADGSRGVQLGGTITFNQTPVVGGSDGTLTFNPTSDLSNGHYEAVVLVNGVDSAGNKNAKAVGHADYSVFINNTAPFNLKTPPFANTANNTAFPFSGNAAPGLTVTVSLTDPMDPNPLTNSYSGSATVPPCPSAPSCPWTVPVDIHNFTSPQNGVTWTAQAADASSATTAKATGPAFNVDYSAPPTVTVNPAPALSADSKTLSVNAQDTAPDVTSYLVTITDPEGNKLDPTFPAQNHNLPPTSIDVTTLDDGQLSITIQAVDTVGNVSATGNSQPYHVNKLVGLLPNLGTSTLSSGGAETTFVQAEQQGVQSPDKVTVAFTQSIKQSYQDQTKLPPTTNNSSMCIASQNGNCLVSDTATVGSDAHSISMPVKNPLADGVYEIKVTTYSAGNCPDKTAVNSNGYSCEQFSGLVTDPNTGQPFRFTVDSSKPSISITSFTNPVTKANEKSVSVAGTVSKTASTVQLLITSSGSSTAKLLANAAITQPTSSSDPNATWKSSTLDLSPLPDGRLTIKATAKKSNGTSASDTVHARMKAHQSLLSETSSRSKVTAGHVVKISGHLSDAAGHAIAHADIAVRPKFASGHFGRSVTVVTNSNGHYSATIKPKHNATYYAKYAGSPKNDGVTVHTARVLVRFAVRITSPGAGATASSPVRVTGFVKPRHRHAVVTFFRHTARGNTVVGHARLTKTSHFTARLSLPAGTDRIFASVKKTAGNLAGKSRRLTLHVH